MATHATPKLTIPSPSMVHYRGGQASIDPTVYPDIEQFWADLSAAYAAEIAALGRLGCHYLQLDDTSLAYLNDPQQRAELLARGEDADSQHLRYIRQINAALAGRPPGMAVTTHMCRGNFRSSWVAEGGYDFVAEALFGELAVDGFFLEYDDSRSGGFEPLRFVPPGKVVVLGLVTTKRGRAASRLTSSNAASTKRPASCPWSSCACLRSAGSPRRWRGTASATRSRWPSCASSWTSPLTCGATDRPAANHRGSTEAPPRAPEGWRCWPRPRRRSGPQGGEPPAGQPSTPAVAPASTSRASVRRASSIVRGGRRRMTLPHVPHVRTTTP